MAVKKGGLGKGLDSLIPSGAPKNKKNITEEKKQPVKVVEKIVEKPVEMKMKITEVEPITILYFSGSPITVSNRCSDSGVSKTSVSI